MRKQGQGQEQLVKRSLKLHKQLECRLRVGVVVSPTILFLGMYNIRFSLLPERQVIHRRVRNAVAGVSPPLLQTGARAPSKGAQLVPRLHMADGVIPKGGKGNPLHVLLAQFGSTSSITPYKESKKESRGRKATHPPTTSSTMASILTHEFQSLGT